MLSIFNISVPCPSVDYPAPMITQVDPPKMVNSGSDLIREVSECRPETHQDFGGPNIPLRNTAVFKRAPGLPCFCKTGRTQFPHMAPDRHRSAVLPLPRRPVSTGPRRSRRQAQMLNSRSYPQTKQAKTPVFVSRLSLTVGGFVRQMPNVTSALA